MSTTSALGKLRQEQEEIERLLMELEAEKKEIDEKYEAVVEKDNKVHAELRESRDAYQYSRLEMRVSMLSKQRKIVEEKKQEIDRKIRGHREELEKVKARIEYMRPKGKLVSYKE